MKTLRVLSTVLLVLVLVGSLSSCDDKNTVVQPTPTATVTFYFDNTIDGAAIEFDTLLYTNPSGTRYSVKTLKYVVSDVTLHRSNGQTFGTDGIHYRDEENDATRGFTMSGIPSGTYDMVSFTFGLDESKNVVNRYVNHPHDFHVAMEWPGPMGGDKGIGYHYMKLEGDFEVRPEPDDSTAGYLTHAGARWLADGNPMTGVEDPLPYHHYFRVYLPISPTSLSDAPRVIRITANMNGWYEDATPLDAFDSEYDWPDLMQQTMMANLDAQEKLKVNGPHCFTATIEAP